ncbi:DUF4294 domain-containing protein [Flavimarina sp. Hel_I_48]|uniref:DUF4294 domain-containing protein n=1 Tax=Flavimarina sp. Hel_I_48 TaxID=1392488 RepID=UPI0004DF03D1|nr:DUF4294 domain-containing protein [Flavimarina sp. Hel_I_48]
MVNRLILFLVLSTAGTLFAQIPPENIIDSTQVEYYFMDNDSTLTDAIPLAEVFIFNRLKFKNQLDRRKYLILRRKTRKVYPYAKLAADRFLELNERLDSMSSNSQRRKYTRIIQRYVQDEFGEQLKKLSRTEGQILVKLIHRQTGITTFDLVKEYRSGWKAFWLNTTASLFDISMKQEFDPINVEEDYLIEDILQRSFQAGILERQEPAGKYNFLELMSKWDAAKSTVGVKK